MPAPVTKTKLNGSWKATGTGNGYGSDPTYLSMYKIGNLRVISFEFDLQVYATNCKIIYFDPGIPVDYKPVGNNVFPIGIVLCNIGRKDVDIRVETVGDLTVQTRDGSNINTGNDPLVLYPFTVFYST